MLSIPIISEFDGKGIDRAVREFKQLETAGEKAQFAIKKAAVPAAAAITGIAVVLGDATKAAMEDAAEQDHLKLILQNTTGASDEQVTSFENQISAMSRASGIADTDYRKAFETLVIGSKDATTAMDDMTLVMDVAKGLQVDSATVADALSKAYEGNFKALKTLSPEIKTMVDDGASLDEIMAVLGGTFGGAVAANAETAAGKMAILKNSIGETKEGIGAALLPVLEAVLPYLQKFADWAQENPDKFTMIAGTIGLIAAAIVITNIAMALNPFAIIAIGVGLLVIALKLAYDKFEIFRKLVDIVFDALVTGGQAVFDGLTTIFSGLYTIFKTLFNGIAKLWNNTIGKLSFKIPNWVPGIGGSGFEVPNIPYLAEGGIVTGPTVAMIGEAGPEAVIPLNQMNGQMGSNVTINITGGISSAADIGRSVVDALTQYSQVYGPLNLAIR
jgi:hypothetical protein